MASKLAERRAEYAKRRMSQIQQESEIIEVRIILKESEREKSQYPSWYNLRDLCRNILHITLDNDLKSTEFR